jgi:hypothetical protein
LEELKFHDLNGLLMESYFDEIFGVLGSNGKGVFSLQGSQFIVTWAISKYGETLRSLMRQGGNQVSVKKEKHVSMRKTL